MKKFMITYHTPSSIYESMQNENSEKKQERKQSWMKWYQENEKNLVDYGAPVVNSRNLSNKGDRDSKIELSGYFIIQAENLDKAISLLSNHPHITTEDSCTLEINEIMPMPNMK